MYLKHAKKVQNRTNSIFGVKKKPPLVEPFAHKPVMPGVLKPSVAGDPLAFSLIEGILSVRILAWLPPVSVEVVLLFELI